MTTSSINGMCFLKINWHYFSISRILSIFLCAKKPLISSKYSLTRLLPNSKTLVANPFRKP
ncbi:Hypothetical protein FP2509 [Flavobacterium psychrophilum JIP02/86]|uniref:Uncharacterized protein n=1 Tax=Flavobacterium psychrophilum (strain ATCC 49511 / DSM 21280 / CIP 103535 / JIP02/86) TaxID=402612 RepID=R7RTQ2_FLAPJ|nr:hypothetical protein GMY06_06660 [Flavobacterium psychrophilum]CDF59550.1 Hypothetical protein FP2509 [Flavobacterium psychrophilum JIP02/86]